MSVEMRSSQKKNIVILHDALVKKHLEKNSKAIFHLHLKTSNGSLTEREKERERDRHWKRKEFRIKNSAYTSELQQAAATTATRTTTTSTRHRWYIWIYLAWTFTTCQCLILFSLLERFIFHLFTHCFSNSQPLFDGFSFDLGLDDAHTQKQVAMFYSPFVANRRHA